MNMPPAHLLDPQSLKDLITSLSPEWRVKVAAMLSDRALHGWLATVADAATIELTTQATYADVAEQLGVSVGMVNRRVSRHYQRERERERSQD